MEVAKVETQEATRNMQAQARHVAVLKAALEGERHNREAAEKARVDNLRNNHQRQVEQQQELEQQRQTVQQLQEDKERAE